MKTNLFMFIAGICMLSLGMMSSCKSEDTYNSYKASRMDLSGAKALTILSNNGSRAKTTEEFQSGLFKIDEQGNLSVAVVYLVTDEDGNTSTKEVPTRVDCFDIVNIGEDYLALMGCEYKRLDTNEPVDMLPLLYTYLMVRKADGRIFGFGGNELLFSVLSSYPKVIKANSDEYLLITESRSADHIVDCLVRLKFDGQQLTCQEMSTNGVVGLDAVYNNGNIYSASGIAGIRFSNGGYDIFEKNSFGSPDITSYLTINEGLAAVRCPVDVIWAYNYDMTFNIINATRPGNATITEVASLKDAPRICSIVGGRYEIGSKILMQHKSLDFYLGDKVTYSVVDKSAGTWEIYEPVFGSADGITISNENFYKGRIWGVEQIDGKLQPKALWIDPTTLESGTVDLDIEVNGIDIRDTVQDYGSGNLVIYGTRRADNANVVIQVDLTTGDATTLFSHTTYEISILVPLN